MDLEAGAGVEPVDGGVADVGLDDDAPGPAHLEEPAQRGGHEGGARARHGGPCGGEEQVHPHVAGPVRVVAGEEHRAGVVGLDEPERDPVEAGQPRVAVRVLGDGCEGAPDALGVGVEQVPEPGPGVGEPGVQELDGGRVRDERLKGQDAAGGGETGGRGAGGHAVSWGLSRGMSRGTSRGTSWAAPRGTPKVWKAMAGSTG